MNFIYASCACSQEKYKELFENTDFKPGQQVQKYNRLLIEGISKNQDVVINSLSSLPINRLNSKKKFLKFHIENNEKVIYNYLPIINIPIIKNIVIFISSFIKTISLGFNKSETVIVCDILSTSVSCGALFASKLMKKKSIAIITDIPFMLTPQKIITNKIQMWLIRQYSAYVLLTEQMNEVVNKNKKPYVVVEGLVDIKMSEKVNDIKNKHKNKICIYAGGINEIYGINYLVEAFSQLNLPDCYLHIYGVGDYEQKLKLICETNDHIKYFGEVVNQKVVEEQLKATLLINPRPTKEEYTKYSFPSKNMEYMVSGTPTLTTKLPGMPKEYYKYVYLINEENEKGIFKILNELLNKDREELHKKGLMSKEYVINNKNNIIQAYRIIDLARRIS